MSTLAIRYYRDRHARPGTPAAPVLNGWELAQVLAIADPRELARLQAETDAAEHVALLRYTQR